MVIIIKISIILLYKTHVGFGTFNSCIKPYHILFNKNPFYNDYDTDSGTDFTLPNITLQAI